MMDWTARHARLCYRLMSRHTRLYTEMVTTGAILHGDRSRHLRFDAREQPLALQLGGSQRADVVKCAVLGQAWGYDEINLNCGCPSDRVQEGAFGACLMRKPDLIADLVKAMKDAVDIPVTVKTRIGVDELDSYEHLVDLVSTLVEAGVDALILHARKALLTGLSPAQNRSIPPLDYARVYRIKQDFPNLPLIINGGIDTLEQTQQHLAQVDGVMMGRAAYQNPWQLSQVDPLLFGQAAPVQSRAELMRAYYPYIEAELHAGTRLNAITRHLLGLFQGERGARRYRRIISERAHRLGAGLEVLDAALEGLIEMSGEPVSGARLPA